MGWKNQVICCCKGYVQNAYGEGALFFKMKYFIMRYKSHFPF